MVVLLCHVLGHGGVLFLSRGAAHSVLGTTKSLSALKRAGILGAELIRGLVNVVTLFFFVIAAIRAKLLGGEIKNAKVVEFLSELKNTSENVHLLSVDNGGVTTSWRG